jgi:hypothetical protein
MSQSGLTLALSAEELPVLVRGDLEALGSWLEACDWRGYDPFDALSSSVLKRFSRRSPFLRQAFTQAMKRSPVNVRPAAGIPKQAFAKALALGLSAYATSDDRAVLGVPDVTAGGTKMRAQVILERLLDRRLETGLWGYEFDVQTRWAYYPAGTSNIIATSFAINALLDAHERWGRSDALDAATTAAEQLVERHLCSEDGSFFRYVPGSDVLIHNANALAAGCVARAGQLAGRPWLINVSGQAATTTARLQRDNGSWPYGEGPGLGWVDAFHTAYTLQGLAAVADPSVDAPLARAVRSGGAFYVSSCFGVHGVPLYYANGHQAGDCHAAATAISYLCTTGDDVSLAGRVYTWARRNLRRSDGAFRSSRGNPIPYVRWSEAHMFLALAHLSRALDEQSGG